MYLNSIYSEEQLKKEYRKKALELHPDLGGSEDAFLRLTQEYKFWKKKLNLSKNDLSQLEVGDTIYVNRTECVVTYVDELSFIAKAKGRVKYAIFDKKTGVGKYNSNYRAALLKEYFNNRRHG
jgi:curved DNA-binding protein CbpA